MHLQYYLEVYGIDFNQNLGWECISKSIATGMMSFWHLPFEGKLKRLINDVIEVDIIRNPEGMELAT